MLWVRCLSTPECHVLEMSEKLLMAFSLRRNFNELTEKGANPKLDFINGGKVLSMAGILFGHRALYSHGLALHNNEFWESVSWVLTVVIIHKYLITLMLTPIKGCATILLSESWLLSPDLQRGHLLLVSYVYHRAVEGVGWY